MAYPQLGPVTGTLLSDPDILLDFVSQLCNLPIEILCLAAEGGSAQYRHVKIPKRRGGKRPVSIAEGVLHTVQATIAKAFINSLPVHPAAHGYVTGRDPLSYAAAHRSAMTPDGYLIRLDVEDFFGHLTPGHIARPLTAGGAEPDALEILCGWCFEDGKLPQGAHTSPALSNVGAYPLDEVLLDLVTARGGIYTRYADDLAISFPRRPRGVRELLGEIDNALVREGFRSRADKLFAGPVAGGPRLTGLIVGADGLKTPREWRRRLRAARHHQATGRAESYSWDATQISGVEVFLARVRSAFKKDS